VAGGFNSSPFVTYGYADGSANTIRPTGITYPNGREIGFGYGSPGSASDAASRIEAITYGLGLVEETHYEYLGLGTIVEADHWQPSLRFTLVGTAGGDDPDTGDIYRGLDRFGRVKDLVWLDDGTNTDAVRIQHGYDRASNRLWRKDPVAASFGKAFDELYTYDGLDRLANMQRGTLNSNHTAVTNSTFAQCWTLDETGNWQQMRQDDTGAGTWDLVQTRTANPVNEITAITNSTGPTWAQPAYDAAGNMTTIPTGNPPGWSDLSVADWSGLSLDGWATMPLAGGPDSYTATYDAWNRLVTLTDGTNTVQENEYDPRNYRTIRKTYTAGVLDETRHYYYSTDWQVLEERLGSDPVTADAERQFVWGLRYIDDLIRRERDTNADGTPDERLYALQDPNWNVVAIADTSGDVQERFAYSAYGVPSVLTPDFGSRLSSNFDWEVLYSGYAWSKELEMYLVRNRHYCPSLGSWTGRDPVKYVRRHNLYEYCQWRPTSITDPLGLDPSLSPDVQRAVDACAGDPNCLRALEDVRKQITDTPRQSRYLPIENKCFNWLDDFLQNYPDYDPKNGRIELGKGTLVLEPLWLSTRGGKELITTRNRLGMVTGSMKDHGVVRVTFSPPGKPPQVAYFDLGSSTSLGHYGGDDHWFWPEEPGFQLEMDVENARKYSPEPSKYIPPEFRDPPGLTPSCAKVKGNVEVIPQGGYPGQFPPTNRTRVYE